MLLAMACAGGSTNAQAQCTVTTGAPTLNYSFSTSPPITAGFMNATASITLANACLANGQLAAALSSNSSSGAGIASGILHQLKQPGSTPGINWGNASGTNTISTDATTHFDVWITNPGNSGLLSPETRSVNVTVTYTMTPAQSQTPLTFTGTLPIAFSVPSHCAISQINNLVLAYQSGQNTPVSKATDFAVYCNIGYSIAVTDSGGTLNGITYTLALSPGGVGLDPALTGRTHTLSATIAAHQSGSCGMGTCSDEKPHQVTVSY